MELSNVRRKSKETTKCEKKTITYDIGTTQCEDEIVKCEKKSKGTVKCEKRTVTCDIRIAQCEDGTIKCEKKVKEPPNVTIELSYVMLEPHNIRIESSNVRKKQNYITSISKPSKSTTPRKDNTTSVGT